MRLIITPTPHPLPPPPTHKLRSPITITGFLLRSCPITAKNVGHVNISHPTLTPSPPPPPTPPPTPTPDSVAFRLGPRHICPQANLKPIVLFTCTKFIPVRDLPPTPPPPSPLSPLSLLLDNPPDPSNYTVRDLSLDDSIASPTRRDLLNISARVLYLYRATNIHTLRRTNYRHYLLDLCSAVPGH